MQNITLVLLVWGRMLSSHGMSMPGYCARLVAATNGWSLLRAGFEARGLMFGAPLAIALGCAFVPLRKPGKLPGERACSRRGSARRTATRPGPGDELRP